LKLKHRENRWVDLFSSAEAALNFRCYAVSKDVVGYIGCLDLSIFPFVPISTRGTLSGILHLFISPPDRSLGQEGDNRSRGWFGQISVTVIASASQTSRQLSQPRHSSALTGIDFSSTIS
jgi:hypothetical protein